MLAINIAFMFEKKKKREGKKKRVTAIVVINQMISQTISLLSLPYSCHTFSSNASFMTSMIGTGKDMEASVQHTLSFCWRRRIPHLGAWNLA